MDVFQSFLQGGEPLCKKDFIKIYEYAYDLNFKITVMSNLSLLSGQVLKSFYNKPPFEISGTLYGITDKTYEEFCKINKGWTLVKKNIEQLLRIHTNLKLHTVLTTYNFHELEKMYFYTQKNKIPFHVYRKVVCDLEGGQAPRQYQIKPEQIKYSEELIGDSKEQKNAEINKQKMWRKGFFNCCAGLSACYLNELGELHLCNYCPTPAFKLEQGEFQKCWNIIYQIRKSKIEVQYECGICSMKNVCGKCAPQFMAQKTQVGFPFSECVFE